MRFNAKLYSQRYFAKVLQQFRPPKNTNLVAKRRPVLQKKTALSSRPQDTKLLINCSNLLITPKGYIMMSIMYVEVNLLQPLGDSWPYYGCII